MCPNCNDLRLNPCLCHKHANEARERAEYWRAWDSDVRAALELYRSGSRCLAEQWLERLGYIGPETQWDYETA